jgi:hypothetical protein
MKRTRIKSSITFVITENGANSSKSEEFASNSNPS